jgi:hypothetical protein
MREETTDAMTFGQWFAFCLKQDPKQIERRDTLNQRGSATQIHHYSAVSQRTGEPGHYSFFQTVMGNDWAFQDYL